MGWGENMGGYCFFFVHPYNLKKFSKEKKEHHYHPRILIKSQVMALDTKLNWFRKKMFSPSFASTISLNFCINPVKWLLLFPLIEKKFRVPRSWTICPTAHSYRVTDTIVQ